MKSATKRNVVTSMTLEKKSTSTTAAKQLRSQSVKRGVKKIVKKA